MTQELYKFRNVRKTISNLHDKIDSVMFTGLTKVAYSLPTSKNVSNLIYRVFQENSRVNAYWSVKRIKYNMYVNYLQRAIK